MSLLCTDLMQEVDYKIQKNAIFFFLASLISYSQLCLAAPLEPLAEVKAVAHFRC